MGVLGVNHIAFRSASPDALRRFYVELTGGEELQGEHGPVRVGATLLVFFHTEDAGAARDDPDELAFDVDAAGFQEVPARAEKLGVLTRQPVEHTRWSKGLLVKDPEGRRIEFVYNDLGVYWRG